MDMAVMQDTSSNFSPSLRARIYSSDDCGPISKNIHAKPITGYPKLNVVKTYSAPGRKVNRQQVKHVQSLCYTDDISVSSSGKIWYEIERETGKMEFVHQNKELLVHASKISQVSLLTSKKDFPSWPNKMKLRVTHSNPVGKTKLFLGDNFDNTGERKGFFLSGNSRMESSSEKSCESRLSEDMVITDCHHSDEATSLFFQTSHSVILPQNAPSVEGTTTLSNLSRGSNSFDHNGLENVSSPHASASSLSEFETGYANVICNNNVITDDQPRSGINVKQGSLIDKGNSSPIVLQPTSIYQNANDAGRVNMRHQHTSQTNRDPCMVCLFQTRQLVKCCTCMWCLEAACYHCGKDDIGYTSEWKDSLLCRRSLGKNCCHLSTFGLASLFLPCLWFYPVLDASLSACSHCRRQQLQNRPRE